MGKYLLGLIKHNIEPTKTFTNLATALAFSPTAEALLSEAKRISEKLGAKLVLIHAGVKNKVAEEKASLLLAKVGINQTQVRLIWQQGDPVKVLTEVCHKEKVDLLILGALKHEDVLKYYIGSIARKISRNPPCSLLLITNPQLTKHSLRKVVVTGDNHPKTSNTIEKACHFAVNFNVKKITIVEEIDPKKVKTKIDDNLTLEQAYHEKKDLQEKEDQRIFKILHKLPLSSDTDVSLRCVFGKKGYSISHYAEVKKASLLVMNSPDNKLGILDRFFPHDLEFVLSDMPCDLMIVHPS